MRKQLDAIMAQGEKKGLILYNICFRKAGVALQWYDEALCVTPEIVLTNENLRDGGWSHTQNKRLKEGLYIITYHKDLTTAIKAELERIENLGTLEDRMEFGPDA